MSRVIIINPYNQTITEQPITGKVELEGLYSLLRAADPNFGGTVERVELGGGTDLWLDEEGCLSGGRPVFQIGANKIAGSALVLDCKGPVTVGTKRAVGEVAQQVRWTDLETTGDFGESSSHDGPEGFVIVGGQPVFRKREVPDQA